MPGWLGCAASKSLVLQSAAVGFDSQWQLDIFFKFGQGVSSAGSQEGLQDHRSGLIREIFRVWDRMLPNKSAAQRVLQGDARLRKAPASPLVMFFMLSSGNFLGLF